MATISFIIPTFNQPQLLIQCLRSLRLSTVWPLGDVWEVIVVNNGRPGLAQLIPELGAVPGLNLLEPGQNLGWEGGLQLGLAHSSAPIVAFCNDDVRFLTGDHSWLMRLLVLFNDPSVGAVGPCSNYVMGWQSIFLDHPMRVLEVRYLIGLLFLARRSALDQVGGVDANLPGGDDLDLSIRLRDAGYQLLCARDTFVFHYGSATGQAVHPGYWNSSAMQEKTNLALIRKHGMLKFWETIILPWVQPPDGAALRTYASHDAEGDLCRSYVSGERVLEVGCGGQKTVARAIGLDAVPAGTRLVFSGGASDASVADLQADASRDLPVDPGSFDTLIARHILEHCHDTLAALAAWSRALRRGGRLIIACPNHELGNTIIMNPEHVAAFTPASLANAARLLRLREIGRHREVNGVSFVMVFEKDAEPPVLEDGEAIGPRLVREPVAA